MTNTELTAVVQVQQIQHRGHFWFHRAKYITFALTHCTLDKRMTNIEILANTDKTSMFVLCLI